MTESQTDYARYTSSQWEMVTSETCSQSSFLCWDFLRVTDFWRSQRSADYRSCS